MFPSPQSQNAICRVSYAQTKAVHKAGEPQTKKMGQHQPKHALRKWRRVSRACTRSLQRNRAEIVTASTKPRPQFDKLNLCELLYDNSRKFESAICACHAVPKIIREHSRVSDFRNFPNMCPSKVEGVGYRRNFITNAHSSARMSAVCVRAYVLTHICDLPQVLGPLLADRLNHFDLAPYLARDICTAQLSLCRNTISLLPTCATLQYSAGIDDGKQYVKGSN